MSGARRISDVGGRRGLRAGWVLLLVGGTACQAAPGASTSDPAREASSAPAGALPTVAASEPVPASWGLGSHDVEAFVAAWDHDAGPDGRGLPPGSGTAEEGGVLYQQMCASCHGPNGEGMSINPTLVATGTPEERFRARSIGEFWPYSSTLFDYLRRSMPQTAPGTLTADQTYALVAWLLAQNGRIQPQDVMDAQSLPRVEMPGRARFVPDDRTGGPAIR